MGGMILRMLNFPFFTLLSLKVETSLQSDSLLYNEIMVLKKKMGVMQKELDVEQTKRAQMEVQIGNILENIKEYEKEIHYLIKESGQKMEQVTSSLCVGAASLGKKSYEEIMSPSYARMGNLGGPSKRTRQSM